MLTEPNLDKSLIKLKIEENFGFKVTNLEFVQGGECSWGYKVETDLNEVSFLKIHTDLEYYELRFDLIYKLYTQCNIRNITHPIKTLHDAEVVFIDKYPTALFNFINGKIVAEDMLDTYEKQSLGELIGKIHRAKEIIGDFAIIEDFQYANKNMLLRNLEKTKDFLNDTHEIKKKTAESLKDNKERIKKRLSKLEWLGKSLEDQNIEFVICHGEPHNWNIMVNKNREVFLIDWDDAIFAPKEKDLWFVKNDSIVMEGYEYIMGKSSLNHTVLEFYSIKWNLSEIEDWTSKIFSGDDNAVQNKHYYEQLIDEINILNVGL